MVGKLRVHCFRSGCAKLSSGESYAIDEFPSHDSVCPFRLVECSIGGEQCGNILAKDLDAHEEQHRCSFYEKGCVFRGIGKDLEIHEICFDFAPVDEARFAKLKDLLQARDSEISDLRSTLDGLQSGSVKDEATQGEPASSPSDSVKVKFESLGHLNFPLLKDNRPPSPCPGGAMVVGGGFLFVVVWKEQIPHLYAMPLSDVRKNLFLPGNDDLKWEFKAKLPQWSPLLLMFVDPCNVVAGMRGGRELWVWNSRNSHEQRIHLPDVLFSMSVAVVCLENGHWFFMERELKEKLPGSPSSAFLFGLPPDDFTVRLRYVTKQVCAIGTFVTEKLIVKDDVASRVLRERDSELKYQDMGIAEVEALPLCVASLPLYHAMVVGGCGSGELRLVLPGLKLVDGEGSVGIQSGIESVGAVYSFDLCVVRSCVCGGTRLPPPLLFVYTSLGQIEVFFVEGVDDRQGTLEPRMESKNRIQEIRSVLECIDGGRVSDDGCGDVLHSGTIGGGGLSSSEVPGGVVGVSMRRRKQLQLYKDS